MALIKCKECGKMISDKTTSCPNCGAPIEKKIHCEECGCAVPPTANVCPQCGCPIKPVEKVESKKSDTFSKDAEKRIQRFLIENRNKLPQNRMQEIRETLLALTDDQWRNFEFIEFKDPTLLLVLSILVGEFGVDRFVLNDIKNGALKLLLTIACGIGLIWWLIDIFKINGMVLNYNYRLLKDTLKYV